MQYNSTDKIELTPTEIKYIYDFNDKHQYNQRTLEERIYDWDDFVEQVVNGYADNIYEYQNDLDTRIVIQELINQVDRSLAEKILKLVEPIDELFNQHTHQLTPPKKLFINVDNSNFNRIPNKLLSELENDLKSVDLI